jgi:hypothetical protein
MTDIEHVKALTEIRNELHNNRAIYHERVTLLIEFISFRIAATRVSFEARIIKPLNVTHAHRNNLYKFMASKESIKFSCAYTWPGESRSIISQPFKLSRPYCPFLLWLDPELVAYVSHQGDEVTKVIGHKLLMGEDWRESD